MDVTLTKKQEEALNVFLDALVGEEPSRLEQSTAANQRRLKRREAREWLYKYAALSMRIGAERMRATLGLQHDPKALAIWKDPRTGAETVHRPIPDGENKVVLQGTKTRN